VLGLAVLQLAMLKLEEQADVSLQVELLRASPRQARKEAARLEQLELSVPLQERQRVQRASRPPALPEPEVLPQDAYGLRELLRP